MAEQPISVRVMAEYESFPLWLNRPAGVSNVDPSDPELGLPQPLAAALDAWSDDYEHTYDPADPASGGFKSTEAAAAFNTRGRELGEAVADALGPTYNVTYVEAS